MIWTLICFVITFFVLKRFAFGPIQKIIDERRDRIRESIDEADRARAEARKLLEEHRAADRASARGEAEEILAEARSVADSQRERSARGDRGGPPAPARGDEAPDRGRDARAALEQIRAEVADLALVAAEKVTRKSLDDGDQRRLIEEAIGDLDFSALERRRRRDSRRAPHVRARALRRREGARPPARGARGARRLRARARRGARARRARPQPRARPAREGGVARRAVLGDADELVRNFVLLVVEKGRAAELDRDRARVRRARRAGGAAGSTSS